MALLLTLFPIAAYIYYVYRPREISPIQLPNKNSALCDEIHKGIKLRKVEPIIRKPFEDELTSVLKRKFSSVYDDI